MAAQGAHFLQVILHIAALAEELVPEQAVHGEDSGALGEIPADLLYGIAHRRLVIAQFQQHQHIGVVHLAETGQGVAADFFDGNDTGVVSVEFAERILESLGGFPDPSHAGCSGIPAWRADRSGNRLCNWPGPYLTR